MHQTPNPDDRISVYFNANYSSPAIAFETFKKAAMIARAISSDVKLTAALDVRDPAPSETDLRLAREEIERYVDQEYLEALKAGVPASLASSNGLGWDENLWNSVLHSTAGILRAIDDVASGAPVAASLSSGLHHATPSRGSGFCTINSLALGALFAARRGLKVVILDLDAHCGGGTEAFLRRYPNEAASILHVDVSVIPFDRYEPRATGSSLRISTRDSYLADIDDALALVVAAKPDLVIYNAGIDIWPSVDKSVVREREARVAKTIVSNGIGCVVVMAGGYGQDSDIVPLHLSTLQAFAEECSEADYVRTLVGIPSNEHTSRTGTWDRQTKVSDDTNEDGTPRCCGKAVPILYGFPGEDARRLVERGEAVLGGCVISMPPMPTHRCLRCGLDLVHRDLLRRYGMRFI
ncbi:MAG: hypothetical protein EBX92_03455 [Actinobacteria bacterium]|nr:hypothetical protein [Actinomycetota bacterium]